MGTANYREFEALAHRLADSAGEVQRRYFRTPVSVETKADASPVTIADREAEAAMRELIAAAYPDHGILGEEHGRDRVDAEFVWVLDPIDGTKSFITGRPLFGTLIALAHRGRPVMGMIDQSILRERWVGVAGAPPPGTAGRSGCGRAPGSRMRSCSRPARPCSGPAPRTRRSTGSSAGSACRCIGGDCYAYGLLAMGFADLVVEASLQPYDFMALVPVIEGAGGQHHRLAGRGAGAGLVRAGGGQPGMPASTQAACELLGSRRRLRRYPSGCSRH